jgi:hypothetical protein
LSILRLVGCEVSAVVATENTILWFVWSRRNVNNVSEKYTASVIKGEHWACPNYREASARLYRPTRRLPQKATILEFLSRVFYLFVINLVTPQKQLSLRSEKIHLIDKSAGNLKLHLTPLSSYWGDVAPTLCCVPHELSLCYPGVRVTQVEDHWEIGRLTFEAEPSISSVESIDWYQRRMAVHHIHPNDGDRGDFETLVFISTLTRPIARENFSTLTVIDSRTMKCKCWRLRNTQLFFFFF